MTISEDLAPAPPAAATDLRIGAPEREAAREALDEHLAEERLDADEHAQRWAACRVARTQSELRRIFLDLPAPHPGLPRPPAPPTDEDVDIPPLGAAVCVALMLGLPVAVVLGFVHDTWWGLAVPVTVSVLLLYVEHLLRRGRATRE
ncbi:DUF1707 SHOCT-like domain-containing protein [Micromonospora sp. H33]|uniref:DUF1707 SHOCT-like domain-containing protein n=1 Tax=Micromonospora sp. H33 TaxID=3452215 RepID=UPI003F8AC239